MQQAQERPVFIVGCPRSGTTLLREALGAHRNLAVSPETEFLADLIEIQGAYWSKLERFGYDQAWWRRHIAEFLAVPHRRRAAQLEKVRWVEKTPRYVMHLDFIASLFPDAQVIHIIRDGRDVVASNYRAWGYRHAMRYAAYLWRIMVNAGRVWGAKAGPARYHELKYEELVRAPEPVLRNTLDFLGEPWDPNVLAFDKLTLLGTNAIFRGKGFCANRVGAGQRELGAVLRLALMASSGRLIRELGYG